MTIQLSDHFTYSKLLRFTVPSIAMLIFTSIYGMVDGLFISNFAGKTAFAAINLIYPPFAIMGAFGFMLGTGGCALVAKTLGEGDNVKANKIFSMLIYITIGLGICFSVIGLLILRPVAIFLGAEGQLLQDCITYAQILLPLVVFFMLQTSFQSYMIAAERPKMGLAVTIAAGVTNMVLDALFIAVFGWGLQGAALATGISMMVGAAIPLAYFASGKNRLLHLGKTRFDGKTLLKACTNGISEMVAEMSGSIVTMLYNFQLMRLAGEDGVAAFGVVGYAAFIFIGVYFGFSMGIAPVISYHYGADNRSELKNLRGKSIRVMIVGGFFMAICAQIVAEPIARIFVGYDESLMEMTVHAMRVFCVSFVFAGVTIFASGFFTALNNGLISAVISAMRTLVFEVSAVMLLPLVFGLDGVWASIIVAEFVAVILAVFFLVKYRKRYHY